MNKVSLNGVKIYPFTSHKDLFDSVSLRKGILVAINAERSSMLPIKHVRSSIESLVIVMG